MIEVTKTIKPLRGKRFLSHLTFSLYAEFVFPHFVFSEYAYENLKRIEGDTSKSDETAMAIRNNPLRGSRSKQIS